MDTDAYKLIVESRGIREYPFAVTATDPKLEDYVAYSEAALI
jgi:hypothetical protein